MGTFKDRSKKSFRTHLPDQSQEDRTVYTALR